jgi:hypothetical protein
MDAMDQKRIVELRREIVSLQRENETYRSQAHHSAAESKRNELRKLRLLAIQEDLITLNAFRQRMQ